MLDLLGCKYRISNWHATLNKPNDVVDQWSLFQLQDRNLDIIEVD